MHGISGVSAEIWRKERFEMNPDLQPQITQMNTDEPVAEKHLRSSVPSAAKKEPAPKISVIVPVYKVEKYLPECIESVLAQTFTDFELILVDDGSPDNCGAICDAYAARDPHIRVFHKENGGVSSARNLGLDHARGEWIAFVDSDDTVGEKYLEHLWGDGPAAGTLVVSGYFLFDENGRRRNCVVFEKAEVPVSIGIGIGNLPIQGYPFSKLYDSLFVAQNCLRFDTEISLGEDTLFMMSYLAHARAVSFKTYADYHYLVRPGSLSRVSPPFSVKWAYAVKVANIAKTLTPPLEDSVVRKRLLREPALSALFSLYRSATRRPRRERIEKIRLVVESLREELSSSENLDFWERMLTCGKFKTFDFCAFVVFFLRLGLLPVLWRFWGNFKIFKFVKNIKSNGEKTDNEEASISLASRKVLPKRLRRPCK